MGQPKEKFIFATQGNRIKAQCMSKQTKFSLLDKKVKTIYAQCVNDSLV